MSANIETIDITDTCTNLPKYKLIFHLDLVKQASVAVESIGRVVSEDLSYLDSVPEPRIEARDLEGLAIAVRLIGDLIYGSAIEIEEKLLAKEV